MVARQMLFVECFCVPIRERSLSGYNTETETVSSFRMGL